MFIMIFFGILAIICFTYYVIMVSYAGFETAFAGVWLACSVFCTVIFVVRLVLFKKNIAIPIWIKTVFAIIFSSCLIFFISVEGCVISGMNRKAEKNLDYIVVLGAQVRGTRLTKSLRKRLEKACEYLKDNANTMVVVSGGQGNGEDVSEARAMYDYFVDKGISPQRIIMEDKSTSTEENIEYSMGIILENNGNTLPKVGVVTNNFHVFRAVKVCEKKGYKVSGISAESDNILLVNYMVREFFALVKYKCSGMI